MLAPIMTKDMKLFPTRPLPKHIKNVRSRAQSLDQFTALQNTSSARGRIVPVKPITSVSTGNLCNATRSPPSSFSRKSTLSAIQEGVELAATTRESTSSLSSEPSLRNGTAPGKKMTAIQHAKLIAAKANNKSGGSGSSSEGASEEDTENIAENQKENEQKQKKKSVVKWLTSAFKKSSKQNNAGTISPENLSTISS